MDGHLQSEIRWDAGRPKGSRNKPVSPGQDLLDTWAEPLMRKCIAMAGQGNVAAMRLCMERISPARRGSLICMTLPKITTIQDVDKAAEKVTQCMVRGKITPTEGEKVMNVLEIRSRLIDSGDFENRFENLKKDVAAAASRPRAA